MTKPLLVLALGALPAVAAAQVPFGPEFIVNAYTNRPQRDTVVAADAAGGFVVAWTRISQYYGGEGVFAQRFDAAGQPRGGELRVSTASVVDLYPPSIAGAADGSFVVAWTSGIDGDAFGIAGRRFGASGLPLGPEFLVNSYSTSTQYEPSVALDAAGGFVVAWSGHGAGDDAGVFAQRFDAAGNRRGAEFRVNTYTTSFQRWPSVAVAPGGAFLVVWDSHEQDGDSWEVFGRRFDAQGVPLGSEFHVNSSTTGFQFTPQAAADGAGNFVVVWDDMGGITGRRYDPAGNPLGVEFTISGYPLGARVAAAAGGAFAVVWEGGPFEVFGAQFDPAGTPGPTFRLNRYTSGFQSGPDVAMLPQGLVAAWWTGDRQGIFARRFGDIGPSALALDTSPGPDSDGNGVLEAGETVSVEPAWANATAAPRPAGGVASGFTGPGAPDPTYAITDAVAAYGTLPPGAARSCADTANCYAMAVGVPSVRPALHWDARFREDVTASGLVPAATWAAHVGDSFVDVPRTSGFYGFVETLLHRSVTAGCLPALYCPGASTSREQMAVFVLRAVEPPWYLPWRCDAGYETFADVPASSPFCPWIEELARRTVVSGCGGGNYCPAAAVSREQMAVFVLRTLDPTLDPPPCTTPVFDDVPAASPFCRWIEELARRGVVTGCGGGSYCPAAPVTREQMSVFLAVTFGLDLYGP